MGLIAQSVKRTLGLTGTLSDGKASSLYYLLFRTSPEKIKADGMDNKSLNKFVHLYGAMETKTRYVQDDVKSAGGSTSRREIRNPPKEVPGLSPKLFVNHLADKTVFMELGDLGLPLVELNEFPIFINMDDEHAMRYTSFHNELEATMAQQYAIGNTGAYARFIPAVVGAANQPHVDINVPLGDEIVYFEAPNGEDDLSAKERRLLEDVKAELAQSRRCVVYVRYSGEAAQDKRITKILKDEGIKAKILDAGVSPEDRIDWLEKAVQQNVEVVVCNAKLVEVGLDLLDFPTLIFYQFTDEVNVMRQSAKRSWRIGQHRACKIIYYVYSKTYEVVQFQRMMKKRAHAMLLEGRADRSALAEYIEHDDKSSSTFNIAACLGDVSDLSKKWQDLADRDIPAGVTMLKEEEFRFEIGRAMKRLGAETCRLAGVPVPVEDDTAEFNTAAVSTTVRKAKRVDKSASDDLMLFALFGEPSSSDSISNLSDGQETPILTVGMARKQMGLVTKAKRAQKVHDDQIMLAL